MMVPGHASSWEGNRLQSFSLYGSISEVWNVGYNLDEGGRLVVMVEELLLMSVITYGPSNLGMNLATHFSPLAVYCCHQFFVDSIIQSPMSSLKSGLCVSFAYVACDIFTFNRLSWASCMSA